LGEIPEAQIEYSVIADGRNIRRLRVQKGISQEALAVDAKIDRTYVSRLERGLENQTVAVLENLAAALDADVPNLFDKAKASKGPFKRGKQNPARRRQILAQLIRLQNWKVTRSACDRHVERQNCRFSV
jgi:transcriptional regulator with XRE-family HTH domain